MTTEDATDRSEPTGVTVRVASGNEYERAGEVTLAAYEKDGFVPPGSDYGASLADAASRGRDADLLVAVDGDATMLGTVTYTTHGGRYAEISAPGEAEFRMLAVDPAARGRGVGAALVSACLDRARAGGCSAVRLSSAADMVTAHRLYERFGFERVPEQDWQPIPTVTLLAYALAL